MRVIFLVACAVLTLGACPAGADWTVEPIAGENTTCWVAMDTAGVIHAMYQIPGNGYGCNCGPLRSFVRLGPGNIVEISYPHDPIEAVRPSMAVDTQRNHYVVYEKVWAGQTSIIRYNYTGNNTWVREGPYDIPGMHGYSPRIAIGPSGNLHVVTSHGGSSHYAFHSGSNLATGWVGPLEHELSGWGDAPGIAADGSDAALVCVEVGPERSGDLYLLRYANGALVSKQKVNSGVSANGYRWPSVAHDYSNGNTYIFARGFEWGDNMEMWTRNASGTISGPVVVRARPSNKDFDCPQVAARNGMVRFVWRESPGPAGERFGVYWTDTVPGGQAVMPGYTMTPCNAILDPNGYICFGAAIWTEAWMGPSIVFQPNPAATGTLTGVVRDNQGAVISGALVEAQAPGRYYQAVTNTAGIYQITSIYPAVYSVAASKLGYQPQTTNGVSVTANQTTTQDMSLAIAQGTFTGTVRDQFGRPVAGAGITATGPGTYSTTTDSAGVYTLTGVAVGNYGISAGMFGYIGQTISGSLEANGQVSTRDISIHLTMIPDIKPLVDWSSVELTRKPVTAVFSADGCFYIEEQDRSSAIRVIGSTTGLAVGDLVNIRGTMSTRAVSGFPSERQVLATSVTKIGSAPRLAPVAMSCRAVGGGPGAGTPGVNQGIGLNNIGMLARIAGRVTKVIGSYVFVDDGSNVANISGAGPETGVMAKCPSTPSVSVGNIVCVTGIIQGSVPTGWTVNRRYMQMRDQSDLTLVHVGQTTNTSFAPTPHTAERLLVEVAQ